jgi:tRNA(Ile)-lysidine synthase
MKECATQSERGRPRTAALPGLALDALPPLDKSALIGVSSGRDSVALLHALLARGFRKIVVCHLDHGLRAESAADARFVRSLARTWKVPCVIEHADVAARAKRRKQSIETTAREARYEFFARVAAKRGCARLFLAHHADDQVETLLFNLLRGSGAAGLGGMRACSTRTIRGVALTIHRPLLGVWREEIDAYVAAHGLDFREDASNADPRHTRNWLRHELLPAIERAFGRDVRPALWRTAEILRSESEVLEAMLPAGTDEQTLALSTLRVLPLGLLRRRLHAWLRARGVPQIGFEEVERVRDLLEGAHAKVNLPGGWHARRRAGWIFLEATQVAQRQRGTDL